MERSERDSQSLVSPLPEHAKYLSAIAATKICRGGDETRRVPPVQLGHAYHRSDLPKVMAKIVNICHNDNEEAYEGAPMTMNVSLTPELEQYVNDKVKSGLYSSASEVVREGLRRLRQEDELRALQLQDLRRDIRAGMESGVTIPIAQVKQHLKQRRSNKKR
jgi:antitoxin ParD1/3/4